MDRQSLTRRAFLTTTLTASGMSLAGAGLAPRLLQAAPAFISLDRQRPQMAQGLQFGDVTATRGMVWSRSDRPARLLVEYSYRPDFKGAYKVRGPAALPETDYTARLDLAGLRAGEQVYVRARFEDLTSERICGEWLRGQFHTAPAGRERDVRFVWGGDTAGQGWGINPDFGGMRIYESMRRVKPDFFIHSGDTIYADGPISAEQDAENGVVWSSPPTCRWV